LFTACCQHLYPQTYLQGVNKKA